jgi:hypothetical protein
MSSAWIRGLSRRRGQDHLSHDIAGMTKTSEANRGVEQRYIPMSVPGRREDGSDTAWFVYDRQSQRSTQVADFEAARNEARLLNAQNQR